MSSEHGGIADAVPFHLPGRLPHRSDRRRCVGALLDQPGPDGAPLTLVQAVTALCERIDAEGLDVLSPHRGHLARLRPLELHAAVNRFRGLRLERGPAAPDARRALFPEGETE